MKCRYCSNKVTACKRIQVCSACYSFMYYWGRKGIKAILLRQERLAVFDARLTALAGNITPIRRRRTA